PSARALFSDLVWNLRRTETPARSGIRAITAYIELASTIGDEDAAQDRGWSAYDKVESLRRAVALSRELNARQLLANGLRVLRDATEKAIRAGQIGTALLGLRVLRSLSPAE